MMTSGKGMRVIVTSVWRSPVRYLLIGALVSNFGLISPGAAAPGGQGAVVEEAGEVRIDWSRGLLLARGAASGDLRAPSPEVARVTARREAREAAQARLDAGAQALMLHGHPVSWHLERDAEARARWAEVLAAVVEVRVEHASDGSVVLDMGLPLEAVRLAIRGARELKPAASDAPTSLIIDARAKAGAQSPAFGVLVSAGDESYEGPAVYYRTMAQAGRDPRRGDRPVSARAAGGIKGSPQTLSVDIPPETLRAAAQSGALLIIVIGKTS